jgi:hypothetical protein
MESERNHFKNVEQTLRETIESLERQVKAKSRVFVPVKRKGLQLTPLQEKVRLNSH